MPQIKAHSRCKRRTGNDEGITAARTTIGIDLSDLEGTYVEFDEAGKVVSEGKLRLTQRGIERVLAARQPALVAIEVEPHSPWVSRLLAELGHEVIVANARQLKLISHGQRKNDRLDAETLARLARADPALLRPLRHRGGTGTSGPHGCQVSRGAGGSKDGTYQQRPRHGQGDGYAATTMLS